MTRLSFAAKTLLLLPFTGVAAWSGNAALLRSQHNPHTLEFIAGSMDDMVADTLETGDVVLFNRELTTMQPLAALHTWVLRKRFHPRFDHCGFIYVDSMGKKFVVEETMDKVYCRPYSARILMSQATEIAVVPLKRPGWTTLQQKEIQQKAQAFIRAHVDQSSRIRRQLLEALVHPMAPSTSPLFPSVALVVEAYESLGLIEGEEIGLVKSTMTPRQLISAAFPFQKSTVQWGTPIPIRLH